MAPAPAESETPTVSSASSVPDARARASYPPVPSEPPFERTAKPGDGQWGPLPHGSAPEDAVAFVTTLHSDRTKAHVFSVVVAFDLERARLHWVPGTDEPKSESFPADRRTGLVRAEDAASTVAAFNGGFMFRHGRYGAMLAGTPFAPPNAESCTVALFPDGSVRIRSHAVVEPSTGSMDAYRQTPPCLLEQGAINPALPTEHHTRTWGAAENGDREVRRSALGLDATGRILFYGFGEWSTATRLAEIMKHVGAVDAAELDINWSYTRFFMVDHDSGQPRLGWTFVEKLEFSRKSYFAKPSAKDFFYVTRR